MKKSLKAKKRGLSVVAEWLKQLPLEKEDIEHIIEAISTVTYKGGHGK
jgi:uncharacterized protein